MVVFTLWFVCGLCVNDRKTTVYVCVCVCEGVCSNIVFVFPKQLLFSFCIVHTLYYRDGLIFHLRITKTRRQKMNRVYVTLFIV